MPLQDSERVRAGTEGLEFIDATAIIQALNHVESDADAGRLGHGLGMRLTEWPSLTPKDRTVLVPGMVLTLEPGLEIAPSRIMVHEKDLVIGDNGAELLTVPVSPELRVLA